MTARGEDLPVIASGGDAATVRDLAFAVAGPEVVPDRPSVLVLPEGTAAVGLERFADRPYRPRADVAVVDVASFVAYVDRFSARAEAAIFAAESGIVGVLNYRGAAPDLLPGHGDDRVVLGYQVTPEWRAWKAIDGKRMTHAEFAQWLEDHVDDVIEPAGAEIVELAREFNVRRDTEFRSSVRLQSGANQIAYAEKDASGVLELPAEIVLGVAPFEGAARYRVRARIRYRLEAGKLAIWFALHRPDLVERAEREAREAEVRRLLEGVPVFRGAVSSIGGGDR